ncbi:MAG TPA: hypothetical protein VGP19_03740 [Candidatus Acidoferrales bacterium]|jgi:hypothetical protein|nr:hypothetical protein [Candidatus Acidoferrales bacterium]
MTMIDLGAFEVTGTIKVGKRQALATIKAGEEPKRLLAMVVPVSQPIGGFL